MPSPHETTGSASAPAVQFPHTLWTVVLEAGNARPEKAQKALRELCAHYHQAILGYFLLKCRNRQDAEDLTGDFILHLLELKRLASFRRESCHRFRHFLVVTLRNFFRDWIDKRKTLKRGGGSTHESIELLGAAGIELNANDPDLSRAVDLGIARVVHERVMTALERKSTDPQRFVALRGFVPFEHGSETYKDAGLSLGLSAPAVRKAVFDLRSEYVLLFRAEVAATVSNTLKHLDGEFDELLALLPEAVALEK